MNIDNLSPELIKQLLCELLCRDKAQDSNTKQSSPNIPNGETYITVMDRSFVYVGKTYVKGDFVEIKDAKNIRLWGTTKGLGELINGPTSATKTDVSGNIIAPLKSIIHFLKCNKDW